MFIDIPDEVAADPWFKVVEFLQQNWAVVIDQNDSALVVFYGDTCGVFDEISFDNDTEAETALRRNGFQKYSEDKQANEFIGLPRGDFGRARTLMEKFIRQVGIGHDCYSMKDYQNIESSRLII